MTDRRSLLIHFLPQFASRVTADVLRPELGRYRRQTPIESELRNGCFRSVSTLLSVGVHTQTDTLMVQEGKTAVSRRIELLCLAKEARDAKTGYQKTSIC